MLDNYGIIVVTGGLGFIGQHLTEALLGHGKEVIVVNNLSTAVNPSPPPGVRFVHADIRLSDGLVQAMKGADLIIHAAANASGTLSVTEPRVDFETNAVGTFNVAEAALNAGAKRLVYVSSASVYGKPQRFPMGEEHPTKPFVPYGGSKLAGELACLSFYHISGLEVVVGRPFCVYGPGENPRSALVEVSRFLRWHLNGLPIRIVGDVDRKTRDFVHVRDLVAGLILIADHAKPGEIFNIGSGEEVSMRRLADIIGEATGRQPVIQAIPDIMEDTYRLVADTRKLRSLGYTPRMALLDGVREIATQVGETPELPSGTTIFKRGQRGEEAEGGRPHAPLVISPGLAGSIEGRPARGRSRTGRAFA